jgi:outer membrane protein assembly factor BamE (lipoprotein component of BamABCDE complex)
MRNLVLAALFLFTLAACGSKLTQENFNQIKNGMPYADVVKLLGEPQSSEGGGAFGISANTSVWRDDEHQVTVVFLNEKVVSKVFSKVQAAQGSPAK